MFIEGIFLVAVGFVFYQLANYYAQRYLGFQSEDHLPMFIPGNASSSKSPLVCVLGWGGCTRRQLRRLLDFYSSHRISTISWINPMYSYFFGIDRQQVERLLDLLVLEQKKSPRIFIHIHSNNGVFVWGYMLNLMKNDERYSSLLKNIKGILFDSAPFIHQGGFATWTLPAAIGASRPCVGALLNRPQYIHWFWTPLFIYYLSIRFTIQRYFFPIPSGSPTQIRDILSSIPVEYPQMYLYSDADLLIPSRVIEQVMAMQSERGVQVTSHRFVKSGHVNHFRVHPEEYGKILLNFLTHKSD